MTSTIELSDVDTSHLAQQALKLFSKRYGRLYDTFMSVGTLYKSKGCITFDDYVLEVKRLYLLPDKPAMEMSLRHWQHLTGGCTPETVDYIDRQRCIDLCVRGYHSKDRVLVDKLEQNLKVIGCEKFDMVDADHDGNISTDEYYAFAHMHDIKTNLRGVFEAMDLDGNGVISKDEFLQCFVGFHLHCDEERYNHMLGVLED